MADIPNGLGPRSDSEAVVDGSASGIATTAARALVMGAALSNSDALSGLQHDLPQIGIDATPDAWAGWEDRERVLEESDNILGQYGIRDDVREREESWWRPGGAAVEPERMARVDLWRMIRDYRASKPHVVAWLRSLMTDREPAASAAAAVALSRWRRSTPNQVVPAAMVLARDLTSTYTRSPSDLARAIALAARGASVGYFHESIAARVPVSTDSVSLMVHGTGAWPGDWWRVGGDFHTYIQEEYRPDLFGGGNDFQWSGKYSGHHRKIAAKRLVEWAKDSAGGELNTVFAHSYGGVIALGATAFGLKINELVLLSVPVEPVSVEWRNIKRAVSLRIHMDLILLAALRRQFFTENVDEHYLAAWFLNHSDSHDPDRWRAEGCAATLGL